MKILLINPNSTESMTAKMAASVAARVGPGVEIIARTARGGPASIEGHYDEVMSLPGLIAGVQQAEAEGIDGVVVACFDDTGLGACREVASGPVVGIGEAAMKAATFLATSFSVVTTLPRSVPIIEENVRKYGLSAFCRRVRASDLPVLALEEDGSNARQVIRAAILRAVEEDRCEAVVLGCAGMADLTQWLTDECGVPVIDGVVTGVKMVEALVGAGLATSKINAYAPPRTK